MNRDPTEVAIKIQHRRRRAPAYTPAYTCRRAVYTRGSSDSTATYLQHWIYERDYVLSRLSRRGWRRGWSGWRAKGAGERVLLRRPGEEPEGSSSKRGKRERENECGREWGGREGEGRGLWMSGRQCRDAKEGIEVSLAPRGWAEWNEWVESRNRMESKGAPVTRSSYVPPPSPPPSLSPPSRPPPTNRFLYSAHIHARTPPMCIRRDTGIWSTSGNMEISKMLACIFDSGWNISGASWKA